MYNRIIQRRKNIYFQCIWPKSQNDETTHDQPLTEWIPLVI